MEAMRESWTDDRLDDLNGKVDAQRVEMKTEFASVRGEMRAGFDKIDSRFERIDDRFDKIDSRFERIDDCFDRTNDRFDALQRTLLQIAGGTIATLIAGFAGIIATQL